MAASIDGRIYKQMVASINSVIIIILILFLIIIVVVFVLIVISLASYAGGHQVTSCPCHCRHQCHYLYLYHLGSRAA